MISALSLMGFACGRSGSNGQAPETQANETNPAGTNSSLSAGTLSMGVKPAARPTNEFVSGPFDLNLRDWSGQVGEFVKAEGKDLETLKLRDGTIFVGEVTRGVPDGQGVLTKSDGTNLQGEWRGGKAYRTSGTWVGDDGTKEIGAWNYDGTACGGTIIWKDDRVYKGDWRVMRDRPRGRTARGR